MSTKDGKKQMMEIEISFGKGRSDHVLVHYGDDPYTLAKIFVKRHGLKEGSISTIGSYLDSTIQDFCATNPDVREMTDSFDSSQLDSSVDYDSLPTRFHNPTTDIDPVSTSTHPTLETYNNNYKLSDDKPSAVSRRYDSPPLEVGDLCTDNYSQRSTTGPLRSSPSPKELSSRLQSSVSIARSPTVDHGIAAVHTPEYYLERRISNSNDRNVQQLEKQNSNRSTTHAPHQSMQNLQLSRPDQLQATGKQMSGKSATGTPQSGVVEQSAPTYSASDLELLNTLSGGDIDHKQFQESLDRNMNGNLQNFSYRKIATELVNSASKQRAASVDHHQLGKHNLANGFTDQDGQWKLSSASAKIAGSVNASQQQNANRTDLLASTARPLSLQLSPSSARFYADAEQTALDQFHASGNHTHRSTPSVSVVRVNSNKTPYDAHPPLSALSSGGAFNQFSSSSERGTPVSQSQRNDQHSQRSQGRVTISERSDTDDDEQQQANTFRSVSSQQHSQQLSSKANINNSDSFKYSALQQQHQRNVNGIASDSRDSKDSHDREKESDKEDVRRRSWESEHVVSDGGEELVEEEDANEAMYNRMKSSTQQFVSRPHKTSLEMGNNKSLNSQSWIQHSAAHKPQPPSLAGKTANERLYLTANIIKDKQQLRLRKAEKEFDSSLAAGKFKLNRASKKIVEKLGVRGYKKSAGGMDSDENHIGFRLHEEGIREKVLKDRRAENMRNISHLAGEWSCAKCGTYHKISTANLVVQPLNQAMNGAEQLQNRVMKVCTTCGWDQGAVQEHQPINIGLALHEDPGAVLNSRRTGYEGVHDYLHSNAQQRDKILLLNKALHEERDSGDYVFQPSIPQRSRAIIEKQRVASQMQVNPMHGSVSGSVGQAKKHNRDGETKPSIGEYVSIPLVERLTQPQTRHLDDENTLYRKQQHHVLKGVILRSSYENPEPIVPTSADPLPPKVDEFVTRLVYEYRDRDNKVKKAEAAQHSHDPHTGQVLFQPVLPVLPSEIYNVNTAPSSSTAIGQKQAVDNILLRDELLKQKKLRAQEVALRRVLNDMHEHQVKALDNSEVILRAATERNIEELFRILLQNNSGNVTDKSAASSAENSVDYAVEDCDDYMRDERTSTARVESKPPVAEEVDLLWVSGDLMIEEVGQLLRDMRHERMSLVQQEAQMSSQNGMQNTLLVDFVEFRRLALRCMRRRDGGAGKAYVYAPKKRPEVAVAMIRQNQQQETFRPKIDKTSNELSVSRQKLLQEQPIELILQAEGHKVRGKVEAARQEQVLREAEELTFKPHLFRPPSYVQARYRGEAEGEADTGGADESKQRLSSHARSQRTVIDSNNFLSSFPPPPPSAAETQGPLTRSALTRHEEKDASPDGPELSRQRSDSSLTASIISSQTVTGPSRITTGSSKKPPGGGGSSYSMMSVKSGVSVSQRSVSTARNSIGKISTGKSVRPPLPLLPHEAQRSKVASVQSEQNVANQRSHPQGEPAVKKSNSRMSLDSAFTQSTSSTVVRKKL